MTSVIVNNELEENIHALTDGKSLGYKCCYLSFVRNTELYIPKAKCFTKWRLDIGAATQYPI